MPERTRTHWSRFVARLALMLAGVCASGAGAIACRDRLDCDEADQQARALLAEYTDCAGGETCQVVDLSTRLKAEHPLGICLDAFVCPVSLREGADQSAFLERAQDLVHRRDCDTCSLAKCQVTGTQQPTCDPETKRCRLRPLPR